MRDVIIPLHTRTDQLTRRAATQRALARERHILAVRYLETGNRVKFLELLRDVSAHEDEARRLESQRDGILEMRRLTARAIAGLLRECGS